MVGKGFFINFEGIDGSGKTTQLARLVKRFESMAKEVVVVKEPGDTVNGHYIGSEIGAKVREILFFDPELKTSTGVLDQDVVDLLFLVDHVQLWRKTIVPALEAGKVVICDRYADSQFAYGVAKGSSPLISEMYMRLYGPTPDATVLLVGNPEFLFSRTKRAGSEDGKQDGKSWAGIESQRIVRDAYLHVLGGRSRTITIEVTPEKDIEAVENEIWQALKPKWEVHELNAMNDSEQEQLELFPDGVKLVTTKDDGQPLRTKVMGKS